MNSLLCPTCLARGKESPLTVKISRLFQLEQLSFLRDEDADLTELVAKMKLEAPDLVTFICSKSSCQGFMFQLKQNTQVEINEETEMAVVKITGFKSVMETEKRYALSTTPYTSLLPPPKEAVLPKIRREDSPITSEPEDENEGIFYGF